MKRIFLKCLRFFILYAFAVLPTTDAVIYKVTSDPGLCSLPNVETPLFYYAVFRHTVVPEISYLDCVDTCGQNGYNSAAIEAGSICLCSKSVIDGSELDYDDNYPCDYPCLDETSKECGGNPISMNHISIAPDYTPISIVITSPSQPPYLAYTDITVEATLPETAAYFIDFGNGYGKETKVASQSINSFTTQYPFTGDYKIKVGLSRFPDEIQTLKIRIINVPNVLSLECPLFMEKNVEKTCNVVSTRIEEQHIIETKLYMLDDPNWPGETVRTVNIPHEIATHFGSSLRDSQTSLGHRVEPIKIYVLADSLLHKGGYLSTWKMTFDDIGLIRFFALEPECSVGSYCGVYKGCTTLECPKYELKDCKTSPCVIPNFFFSD